jgi:hypothetical protein
MTGRPVLSVMTGSCVPVLQDQFVDGRVVATTVTDAEVSAIDKAGDAPAHLAVADTQTLRKRRLKREAHSGFLVEHLADDESQPQLLCRRLRIGVDLLEAGEYEAGEIGAGVIATLARCR